MTLLFFGLEGRHLRGECRVAGVGGDLFEALVDACHQLCEAVRLAKQNDYARFCGVFQVRQLKVGQPKRLGYFNLNNLFEK